MLYTPIGLKIKTTVTFMNLPNLLTTLRITLIPLMGIIYFSDFKWSAFIATGVFLLASMTDWLDGFLARKLKQESKFGEFLDPVADKLIVVVALLLLIHHFQSTLITFASIVIICRELFVSALREWMSQFGKRNVIAVSQIAKAKTFMQMFAISVLLLCSDSYNTLNLTSLYAIGVGLLYVSVVLTIWSMLNYVGYAYKNLNK